MKEKFAAKLTAGPLILFVSVCIGTFFSTTFVVVAIQLVACVGVVIGAFMIIDGIGVLLEKVEKVLDNKIKDAERREMERF